MGKIFCIIGKSSTGKDTLYQRILERKDLQLRQIVSYTTRPIRAGEVDGTEYDGNIDLEKNNYLVIGTIASFVKLRDYFSEDAVLPIYIEVEDGIRLQRALDRERCQMHPKYEEMCRRFLADAADFSKEKLQEAGIHRIFYNEDLERTEEQIVCFMREVMMSEEV